MDLSKIKPETIKQQDELEKDQLGTLKISRHYQDNREKIIQALRQSKVKINRAKKLKKSIKNIFQLAQDIKKKNAKAKPKPGKSLKEFLDHAAAAELKEDMYNLQDLKLIDLESIRDFIKFVAPIITKKDKGLSDIFSTWQSTLERIIEDFPRTFDDYAKEVIKEILDAIFELDDEAKEYIDKLELATSPFWSSDLTIAVKPIDGDYENT